MLGVGGAKKTYLDDVFSTQVYTGTGAAKTITNGIDFAGKGGMVWHKRRSSATHHALVDTVRGKTKSVFSSYVDGAQQTYTNTITAFNNNGYTLGTDATVGHYNTSGETYASWSFRKAPGFFDVVQFTAANSSNQRVSHSLGCIPGLILIKNISGSQSWFVYHRETGEDKYLKLNDTSSTSTVSDMWGPSGPTATDFGFKSSSFFNTTSGEEDEVIAYLFAGGLDTSSHKSVRFEDGSDRLISSTSTDYQIGIGAFTAECWFKADTINNGDYNTILATRTNNGNNDGTGWSIGIDSTSRVFFYDGAFTIHPSDSTITIQPGTWYHIAIAREGTGTGQTRLFVNGNLVGSGDCDNNFTNQSLGIGNFSNTTWSNEEYDGLISNVRFTKGQALYTSSFIPSRKPLTTTSQGATASNVKLICCNSSTSTGTTVGTVTQHNDPPVSSDSPIIDTSNYIFGENEDQNLIVTGSYTGNGSSTGPEIYLGWEPQWVMIKWTSEDGGNVEGWYMVDSMRGIITAGNDADLKANQNTQETIDTDGIDLTPTGFKVKNQNDFVNNNGTSYIYLAIRRPDGYVGKPIKDATKCFAMDTGAGGTTIPNYDSGFPVDMAIDKIFDSNNQWYLSGRLTGTQYLRPDSTTSQASHSTYTWDSNVGWGNGSWQNSTYQSWMWKRHAGFDVITYKSNGVAGRQLPHSLGRAPEMLWIKDREHSRAWAVYHKGLNGGTNPEDYWLGLDDITDGGNNTNIWHSTAPTATHISLGSSHPVNTSLIHDMICLAFASVNGISKVGRYSGSDSEQTITTGFQPRFVIIRRANDTQDWVVLDTVRGWGSGDDTRLELNNTSAQNNNTDFGAPISTGFTLEGATAKCNASGGEFIYYAHA